MKKQDYTNYRKYYIPHHFIFLPVMIFLVIWGVIHACNNSPHRLEWKMFSVLSFSILYLGIMLRQHYALGNQDRIVRLEFRLRYYELFHQSSKQVEETLSFSQIAALRFADDEEFRHLLDRAVKENMSGKDIKKSIKKWQADDMRV